MPWKNVMLFIGALLFFSACSTLPKGSPVLPGSNIPADQFVKNILGINDKLETFQGVGKFRLYSRQGLLTSRVAWIGDKNSKLRIEVLGPGGRSQASFAAMATGFMPSPVIRFGFTKCNLKIPALTDLFQSPSKQMIFAYFWPVKYRFARITAFWPFLASQVAALSLCSRNAGWE